MNRRELLKAGVSALPMISRFGIVGTETNIAASEVARDAGAVIAPAVGIDPEVGWQRRVRRIGQLNMTEHDPVALDVEAWADYWASVKAQVVFVSVTGILAFYQTK